MPLHVYQGIMAYSVSPTTAPERFLSDSNIVGAEKVSVTKIPKEYLDSEWKELPSIFGGE